MNHLYNPTPLDILPSPLAETSAILICIHRIDELLDEEMRLLDHGSLDELERINIRKSHLLAEFSRLAPHPSADLSSEINLRLDSCRLKAERNFEALGTYLRAMEDLNQLILEHLRKEESDGTYARPNPTRHRD